MGYTYKTTHVPEGLGQLLAQFQEKPKFAALLTAILNEVQAFEDALNSVFAGSPLANASGQALDRLGAVLNLPRNGLPDASYQQALYGEIAANMSLGTPEQLISIFKIIMQASRVEYQESYPATIEMTATNCQAVLPSAAVRAILNAARPAGTSIGYLAQVPSGLPFSFDGNPYGGGFGDVNDPNLSTAGGFVGIL